MLFTSKISFIPSKFRLSVMQVGLVAVSYRSSNQFLDLGYVLPTACL